MSTDQQRLDQAYRFCRNVTRRRARNFYYGLKLTPEPQRSALYSVYAWMRRADDLVDNATKITDDLRRDIAAFRGTTDAALSGRVTVDEHLWVALADTAAHYDLPREAFHLTLLETTFEKRPEGSMWLVIEKLRRDEIAQRFFQQ